MNGEKIKNSSLKILILILNLI